MWKFIKYFIWLVILVLVGYFLWFLKPATFLPNEDRVAPLTETAQERENARQEAIENIPDVSGSFPDTQSSIKYSDDQIDLLMRDALAQAFDTHEQSAYYGELFDVDFLGNLNDATVRYMQGVPINDPQSEIMYIRESLDALIEQGVADSPQGRFIFTHETRLCILDALTEGTSILDVCDKQNIEYLDIISWKQVDDLIGYYETLPFVIEGLRVYGLSEYGRSLDYFNHVIAHYEMLPENLREFVGENYLSNLQLAEDMIMHIGDL